MKKYDLFISYAEDDRAWVEGYLLDALQSAEVRCHSRATFELGKPILTAFEDAIKQSSRCLLIVSPAYFADDYNQFVESLAQHYGLETDAWLVIPFILKSVELPSRLGMLNKLDATDDKSRETVIQELCKKLKKPLPVMAPKPDCPYPGLEPFTESKYFFGRTEKITNLLDKLQIHRLITIIGPSGSGKSSLVFAGLVAGLDATWCVHKMRPADFNIGEPIDKRQLFIIDQFEELFYLSDERKADFHLDFLALLEARNCSLIITVRDDFYSNLLGLPYWDKIENHCIENVLPLTPDGLREAIEEPAKQVGVYIEDALVERLVNDAALEPGFLPLVQQTLVLLWQRLGRRFLSLSDYETIIYQENSLLKGLPAAIALYADGVLVGLDRSQMVIAKRVFLRLIQFGEGRPDTRRQQLYSNLVGNDADDTIEYLASNRLLTLSGKDEKRVDIAHEALINSWPSLQNWIKDRCNSELVRRRLEAKVKNWEILERKGGFLDTVELREVENWLSSFDAKELGYSGEFLELVDKSREIIDTIEREKETVQKRELEQAQTIAEEQRKRAEALEMAEAERKERQKEKEIRQQQELEHAYVIAKEQRKRAEAVETAEKERKKGQKEREISEEQRCKRELEHMRILIEDQYYYRR
ncbi:TIR domain-containing protein [Candidatus Halobeggiatoa sp. HSG11]|nr:TIR domain-containing protein [Candidatus Halobeggiatoa sp. HSG11]